MICPVSSMRNGQWGTLIEVEGGDDLTEKLASLGIRTGTRLGKKYGLLGRGPVVLIVGTGEVAIGYGMASRMMAQVETSGEGTLAPGHPHTGHSHGRRFGFFRGRKAHSKDKS